MRRVLKPYSAAFIAKNIYKKLIKLGAYTLNLYVKAQKMNTTNTHSAAEAGKKITL